MQDDAAAARSKWEERYAAEEYQPPRVPSPFVVAAAALLRPGRALCLAAGAGRNAVWLATQGWQVTAVDISARGLRWCRRLAAETGVVVDTVQADLGTFDLGESCWDLVTVVFFHDPALFPSLRTAVRPGGHLLLHTFSVDQLRQGWGPSRATHLVRARELHTAFGDWRWRRYADDEFDREEGRREHTIRLLARRPTG